MKSFEDMEYNPLSEKVVNILGVKTQCEDLLFFRVMFGFYLTQIASSMRAKVNTPDRGIIPINMYALCTASSGFGKGHSTTIVEDEVLKPFRDKYKITAEKVAETSIAKVAQQRAARKSTDPDDELVKAQKEHESLGHIPFSFDSATVPAFKQVRHNALFTEIGSLNFICDEIGSNLLGNSELLTAYLECYTGDVKVLTDRGYVRFDELNGTENIAQYTDEGLVEYVPNEHVSFIRKPYEGKVYDFITPTGFDFTVTENHDLTLQNAKGELIKKKPSEVNAGDRIITSKQVADRKEHISDLLRLQLAFQADGTFKKYGAVEFSFSKERKIARLH